MKVKFVLHKEIIGDATAALLLGDFNNWDPNEGISLKVQKDGNLAAEVALETGKSYQYRYFLNDGRWVNDANANQYAHHPVFQVDNCVIFVPEFQVIKPATKKTPKAKAEKTKKAPAEKASKPAKTEKAVKAELVEKVDDLTVIEGIGKKIAELLVAAGINSFAALAKSSNKKLLEILAAAGPKFSLHEPASWPKQAKLAAAGKLDELALLQEKLKGGK